MLLKYGLVEDIGAHFVPINTLLAFYAFPFVDARQSVAWPAVLAKPIIGRAPAPKKQDLRTTRGIGENALRE